MHRPCLLLLLLTLALLVAGCGDDDDSGDAASTQTGKDEIRRAKTAPNPKEVAGARQERADEKRQKQEEQDLEDDEEFDKAFEDTPFDRVVDKLPIRKPPLHVQQYISGDGHKLYAAVSRKRFCALSAARRNSAVGSFFDDADRTFRRGGIDDLELVVTPLAETLDKLPPLATASGKTVKLTSRGRDC